MFGLCWRVLADHALITVCVLGGLRFDQASAPAQNPTLPEFMAKRDTPNWARIRIDEHVFCLANLLGLSWRTLADHASHKILGPVVREASYPTSAASHKILGPVVRANKAEC